jgi:hypothetical protein
MLLLNVPNWINPKLSQVAVLPVGGLLKQVVAHSYIPEYTLGHEGILFDKFYNFCNQ